MIEILVIDLCAALLAPELQVRLTLSQAEKDGLRSFCYGDLPRSNMRRALRLRGLLQGFDGLLHSELMPELTAPELRKLADKACTFWMRTPAEVDYKLVLPLLSPRRRRLPKALRLPVANDINFGTDAE